MQKEISHSWVDFCGSWAIWDNTPILKVYFDDREVIEQELNEIRKTRSTYTASRVGSQLGASQISATNNVDKNIA